MPCGTGLFSCIGCANRNSAKRRKKRYSEELAQKMIKRRISKHYDQHFSARKNKNTPNFEALPKLSKNRMKQANVKQFAIRVNHKRA